MPKVKIGYFFWISNSFSLIVSFIFIFSSILEANFIISVFISFWIKSFNDFHFEVKFSISVESFFPLEISSENEFISVSKECLWDLIFVFVGFVVFSHKIFNLFNLSSFFWLLIKSFTFLNNKFWFIFSN